MIYTVTLTYRRPINEIEAHLGSHKQWLAGLAASGALLAAGPLADGSGGVMLIACPDQAALDHLLAGDSYQVHQLVETVITGFEPAIRAEALAAAWAPQAKAF